MNNLLIATDKNGPFFRCVISNRCLYTMSVICFNIEQYSVDENIIFMVKSYDGHYYICATCDKALRKNSAQCQAVANRFLKNNRILPYDGCF